MEALATGWKGEEVPHPAHFSAMLLPSKTLFQIPSLSTYSSFSLPQVNGSLPSQIRESHGEASGLLLTLALFTV